MSLRAVVRFPDPFLRKPTHEVETITPRIFDLVEDMIETMYKKDGVGLAAIQIGASERIFVIESSVAGKAATEPPLVFINPKIEWMSEQKETDNEGCLSFPGVFVAVPRSLQLRITALDLQGLPFTVTAENFYARALQHEQDHLDNKLLIDYVGPVKRQVIRRKMERMTDEDAEAYFEGASR